MATKRWMSVIVAIVLAAVLTAGIVFAATLIISQNSPLVSTLPSPLPEPAGNCGTGCGAGYVCIQKCGPPVVREGDAPPGYYCERTELAKESSMCPICLASNTLIATPDGEVKVQDIVVGDIVWSVNMNGERVSSLVTTIGSMQAPASHQVIHFVLSDGREVWLSPNHPGLDGRPIDALYVGEKYDNAVVVTADLVPYWDEKTYDILPDGETGLYFANGIVVGSTLRP